MGFRMEIIDAVFLVAIIMFSAVIHELMHGVAANKLGDPTARLMGRLTLNPIVHLDMFGSIILPSILTLTHSPLLFGWAKPVPYNPYNLRPGRFSEAIVAGAGPASNLAIALIGGLVIRSGLIPAGQVNIVFLIIVVNVMLCIFNLIPIPPLDGSKVLPALLPRSMSFRYDQWRMRMEGNPFIGIGAVLIIILLLGSSFGTLIYGIASAISGV
jgi:Zn-dependent protease